MMALFPLVPSSRPILICPLLWLIIRLAETMMFHSASAWLCLQPVNDFVFWGWTKKMFCLFCLLLPNKETAALRLLTLQTVDPVAAKSDKLTSVSALFHCWSSAHRHLALTFTWADLWSIYSEKQELCGSVGSYINTSLSVLLFFVMLFWCHCWLLAGGSIGRKQIGESVN